MFSCKFAAYFKNTFYWEHLWVAGSDIHFMIFRSIKGKEQTEFLKLRTIDSFILPTFDHATPTDLIIKILLTLADILLDKLASYHQSVLQRDVGLCLWMAYLLWRLQAVCAMEGLYKEMSFFWLEVPLHNLFFVLGERRSKMNKTKLRNKLKVLCKIRKQRDLWLAFIACRCCLLYFYAVKCVLSEYEPMSVLFGGDGGAYLRGKSKIEKCMGLSSRGGGLIFEVLRYSISPISTIRENHLREE